MTEKSLGQRENLFKKDILSKTAAAAVLINSARIYCGAMDQASNVGVYPGWIRDEVAIHFDIFTVRTVRFRERPSWTDIVGSSLYLLE